MVRTAEFPGRWYLLGTGFDGSIWWDEPGLGFLEVDVGQPLAFGFFFACRWATTGVMGVSSCVSLRYLLENFLLLLLAWSTLGNLEHFLSRPCIWQSCFRCLGVVRRVQVLEFSGDAAFYKVFRWLGPFPTHD